MSPMMAKRFSMKKEKNNPVLFVDINS